MGRVHSLGTGGSMHTCCAHAHSTRRCVGRMFGVEVDLGSAAHAALRANLTLLANLSDPEALSLRGV